MKQIIPLSFQVAVTLVVTLIIILLIAGCGSSSSDPDALNSAEGIHFVNSSFKDAAILSKQENKPIFLFAHASYCSACKKMIKEVFPDKNVGDTFNSDFINVQVDIESAEGEILAKRFELSGTPMLIYLAPDGQVIYKSTGYQSANELIAQAKDLKTVVP